MADLEKAFKKPRHMLYNGQRLWCCKESIKDEEVVCKAELFESQGGFTYLTHIMCLHQSFIELNLYKRLSAHFGCLLITGG